MTAEPDQDGLEDQDDHHYTGDDTRDSCTAQSTRQLLKIHSECFR